jgi:twinkle protein
MNTFSTGSLLRSKEAKEGAKKTTCPLCSHTRKKKTDPCLSVNFDTGKAKCWNCEALSFREQAEVKAKPYTLPAQNWQNYTALSEKMVRWCEDVRKVRQSTLIDLGVTEEMAYMPSLQKEVNCLTFNYFEGEQVVNKKYRDARKNFTQSKNGKAILYNINSIIGASECYIVEGEFDVLAMHTHGIKNVVSVPNGANDHDDYWINSEPYLKDIKRFIIATDTDEKGIALRERIAQRLGRYRCSYIDWSRKDANGSLIEGCIADDIANVKRFAISGTFTVSDLYDGIIDLYDNGLPKTIKPKHECFGNMADIFSVMRGHVVTVTGIPSHGKSALASGTF